MRKERSPARRFLVVVLVAGGHLGLILLLAKGLISQPRGESGEDPSISMILFPLETPDTTERVPVDRHARHHQMTPSRPIATAAAATPPVPSSEDSGKSVDWTLEMQHAAASALQAPETRDFGGHRQSEVEVPHRSEPAHHAGESYRDMFGDTIAWINARCYLVSEAPQLGVPTVFARMQPTRVGCIRHGPAEGALFMDLPAYKKLHPQ